MTVRRWLRRAAWVLGIACFALGAYLGVLVAMTPSVELSAPREDAELAAWVEERLAARRAAREARDFARADAIRLELADRGVEIRDTPDGTTWKRIR